MYIFTLKNKKLCKLIFFIINKKYFNEDPKIYKQNEVNKQFNIDILLFIAKKIVVIAIIEYQNNNIN